MCAHPETALTVLEHRQYEFVRQSVSHGVAGKFSVGETAEPRMPCPDPQSTRSVLISCVGVAIDQPLLFGVAMDGLILQPVKSFFQGAEPEITLPVFVEVPGRDRNSLVGAQELKGSLKARTQRAFPKTCCR